MSKNRIVKLDLDAHREVKQAVRNPISMFIKFQLKAQRKEDPDFKLSKDYIAEMTEAWSDLPQARQQKYIDYVRLDQKREKSIKKGKNLYKEYLNKKTRKGSDEARVKEMIKRPKAVTPLFRLRCIKLSDIFKADFLTAWSKLLLGVGNFNKVHDFLVALSKKMVTYTGSPKKNATITF